MAMLGLSKLASMMQEGQMAVAVPSLLVGWPGIYAWSSFFFFSRIQNSKLPKQRRATLDIISATWFALSRDDVICLKMARTPGCLEIATKLWFSEDNIPGDTEGTMFNFPTCTASLFALLEGVNKDILDRVVKAAGGKPELVSQLALSKLRSGVKNPKFDFLRMHFILNLCIRLSRINDHPLQNLFVEGGIITLATKALVRSAAEYDTTLDHSILDVIIPAFGLLWNLLETGDGVRSIIQALRAGLLTAWVDLSRHINRLEPEDRDMVIKLVKTMLPRYLVYRSVVNAVGEPP